MISISVAEELSSIGQDVDARREPEQSERSGFRSTLFQM